MVAGNNNLRYQGPVETESRIGEWPVEQIGSVITILSQKTKYESLTFSELPSGKA